MSVQRPKQALCVLSTLLILVSYIALLFPVFSVDADAANSFGGAVPSSLFTDGTVVANHDNWTVGEEYTKKVLSNKSGKLIQISSENASLLAGATFDEDVDSKGYREIGIYVTSVINSECTITLTADLDSGTVAATVDIPYGTEHYVFMPLKDDANTVHEISVKATLKDSHKEAKILLGNAVLSHTDHTDSINSYSAFHVDGIDENSRVYDTEPVICKNIIIDAKGEDFAIIAEISGGAGGVTFHYSENGEEFSAFGSAVLSENRSFYVFSAGNINENSAYKLEFTGVGDKETVLKSVSFISMKKSTASPDRGTVTKCHIADDTSTLTVTGTITHDTVIEHIDGDICLFEVPLWSIGSAHLYSADPIASGDMSSSFNFSLDLGKDHSIFSAFVVAIKSHGKLYTLSDPIFPSRETAPAAINTTVSVGGVSCEDAFAAGFDNYVIDIDVQSFFRKKSSEGSTVFTFDGKSHYADRDTVSLIDKKAAFLKAAGIGIIFNITEPDSSDVFDVSDESGCRTVAAVTSFLSQRYSPHGFIISSAISERDASKDAYNAAALTRLVSAAAGANPTVYTFIDSENAEVYAWLLSSYMSRLPKVNAKFLLPADAVSGISEITAVETSAAAGGYQADITLFESTSGSDASSLTDNIEGDYSYIIRITDDLSPSFSLVSEKKLSATLLTDLPDTSKAVTLWDFTRSYDPGGFTVSPSSSGIFTRPDAAIEEFANIRSCRAVKTVLNGESTVLIATPDNPISLTNCPKFSFLMSCETDSPVTFDVIFISGHDRVVFTLSLDSSGVYSPICDLTGTSVEQKIDRIALVLKDGDNADIGIATVFASGDGISSDAASTVYITDETIAETVSDTADNTTEDDPISVYIYIGIIIGATVFVFAVLSIKKA